MSRLVLIAVLLLGIPLLSTIGGAVYYGWLGGLAGFGLGILVLKLCGKIIKYRFNRILEKQMEEMEEASKHMESATITVLSLEDAPKGDYLDGEEEFASFYPQNFYLSLDVDPMHEEDWQPAGMHLQVNFDDDLLDDHQDPDELGLGLYLYGVELKQDDDFVAVENERALQGPQQLRFHFSAGKNLQEISVYYHMKSLLDYKLSPPE
jgi:hypothetical protein